MIDRVHQSLPDGPLVAWYGDDYTGASAVMEVLTFAGLPAVLFFDIPTREQLDMFSGYRGIGIAGVARSKSPKWMEENLPTIFAALANFGAPITHYKVCSTLDSSPEIGSIGKAAELAHTVFKGQWIPVVIAAPEIARYQVFGNLFASAGDKTFRLDRHPTMSRHPVTPMDEADVLSHLRRQTDLASTVIDILTIKSGQADSALNSACNVGAHLVALDILDQETLAEVGRLIWDNRANGSFAIGSQGLEYALAAHWREVGNIPESVSAYGAGRVKRMAIVSGSCSSVTADQIAHAGKVGFEPIRIDPSLAVDEAAWRAEIDRATKAALDILSRGADPIVYSSSGPDDPTIGKFNEAVEYSSRSVEDVNSIVGRGLGEVLGALVRQAELPRGVIAGGDTSSHGASTLGIYALTAKAPVAPGVALCEAHSDDPALAGFQIALKGGQMGNPNIFEQIRQGGVAA